MNENIEVIKFMSNEFYIHYLNSVEKYSIDSIYLIDKMMDGARKDWVDDFEKIKDPMSLSYLSPDQTSKIMMAGAYYGDCFINKFGGKWIQGEENTEDKFYYYLVDLCSEKGIVNPIRKVIKRFALGNEDNLESFFKFIDSDTLKDLGIE